MLLVSPPAGSSINIYNSSIESVRVFPSESNKRSSSNCIINGNNAFVGEVRYFISENQDFPYRHLQAGTCKYDV